MPRTVETDLDCHVLIAGFGPVGAALAALLGQHGLSVIVVEPEADVYPLPRAAHIDHEVTRILQALGIVDALHPYLRPAPDYEFRNADGALLMRVERAGITGASGWPVGFNFYQPGLERVLRDAVAALPGVRVLHGARFAGLIDSGAARVTAAIARDGVRTPLAARFLIGCDGASSAVREAIGAALDDYAFDEPWLVVDAKVADESGFPPVNLQLCDPARPVTFVHMAPGRLRWEFMLRPGEDPAIMRTDAALDPLLAPWRARGDIAIERRAVYRFHGLVARRWRQGGVFLAGDAAHQMPPFMGQGLCAGLRDVANLAWKLAGVVRGGADPALLDSYQTEREPHVRFVIERAIEMGRMVCTLDPAQAASRDAAMLAAPRIGPPVPFPPLAGGCILAGTPQAGAMFPQPIDPDGGGRLDDWLGRGPWLIQRQRGHAGPHAPRPEGLILATLDSLPPGFAGPLRDWLDRYAAEAVLVRPDRYVFGSGPPDRLLAAYAACLAPSAPPYPLAPDASAPDPSAPVAATGLP